MYLGLPQRFTPRSAYVKTKKKLSAEEADRNIPLSLDFELFFRRLAFFVNSHTHESRGFTKNVKMRKKNQKTNQEYFLSASKARYRTLGFKKPINYINPILYLVKKNTL